MSDRVTVCHSVSQWCAKNEFLQRFIFLPGPFKIVSIKQNILRLQNLSLQLSPETVWEDDKCVSLDWSHKQKNQKSNHEFPVEILYLRHLVHLSLKSNKIHGQLTCISIMLNMTCSLSLSLLLPSL